MEESFPRGRVKTDTAATKAVVSTDRLFGTSRGRTSDKADGASRPKSKSKSARSASKGPKDAVFEPDSRDPSAHKRADELNFKRLRPGIALLCRIKRITSRQLVLALPHGLTGFVPLSEMSEPIKKAIISKRKSSESDEDSDDASESSDEETAKAKLRDLFVEGQFVPAVIVRVGGETLEDAESKSALQLAKSLTGAKSTDQRKILLSLRPELVNAGIGASQLKVGSMLPASIRSVEAHGYVVNTGIEGLTAFLPFESCDSTLGQPGTRLSTEIAGQSVFCTVAAINRSSNNITLACTAERVAAAVAKEASHTIFSLKPGMMVETKVDKVLTNGVLVTFLGFFKGTLHCNHLPFPAHALWANNITVGSVMNARILYTDTAEKTIALSAAPFVVGLGGDEEGKSLFGVGGPDSATADGDVVEKAVVIRVDPNVGLFIGWQDSDDATSTKVKTVNNLPAFSTWGHTAFVHISRISDTKVEHVERLYKVGDSVRARIVGTAGIEGYALASINPTIVDATVLRVSDVHPGDIVEGTVKDLLPSLKSNGGKLPDFSQGKGILATIKLGETVIATLTTMHVADVLPALALSSSKARTAFLKSVGLVEGARIKCRVVSVSSTTGRILVSLKKSLLDDSLNAISTYEQAAEALATGHPMTSGVVTGIREAGVVVSFFGDVHGLLPMEDIAEHAGIPVDAIVQTQISLKDGTRANKVTIPASLLQEYFKLGQVLPVTLTACDPLRQRLRVSISLDQKKGAGEAPVPSVVLPLGTTVDLTVLSVVEEKRGYLVHINRAAVRAASDKEFAWQDLASPIPAMLPFLQLSDHTGSHENTQLLPGAVVRGAVVLEQLGSRAAADTRPHYVVSCKPLLQLAVKHYPESIPDSVDKVRTGLLVVGYVASVTAFGAFVRLLGSCTGLAPRSKWHKSMQDGSQTAQEYQQGQSVIGVVESVATDASKGRFIISLYPGAVSRVIPPWYQSQALPSDITIVGSIGDGVATTPVSANSSAAALFLKSRLVDDEISVRDASTSPSRSDYAPGTKVALKNLKRAGGRLVGHKSGSSVSFIVIEDIEVVPEQLEARVVDVSADGVLVTSVLNDGSTAAIELGSVVSSTVRFVHPDKPYVVVSFGEGDANWGVLSTRDFFDPVGSIVDVGDVLQAVVTQIPTVNKKKTKKASTAPGSAAALVEGLYLLSGVPSLLKDSGVKKRPSTAKLIGVAPQALRAGMEVSVIPRWRPENEVEELPLSESGFVRDIAVRLVGVTGSYDARIPFAELVEYDPLLGVQESGTDAVQSYLSTLRKKQQVPARIVSVVHSGEAGSDSTVKVCLTTRRADVILPESHLACLRPSVYSASPGTDARTNVLDESTLVAASSTTLSTCGSGNLYSLSARALLDLPGNRSVVAGATGYGVVEGYAEDRCHIWIGLGAGLHGRAFTLECGNTDEIRSPESGDLVINQTNATKLSFPQLQKLHPIGSIVPFVVTDVHVSVGGRASIEVSIRRARAAINAQKEMKTEVASQKKKSKREATDADGKEPSASKFLRAVEHVAPLVEKTVGGTVQFAVISALPSMAPFETSYPRNALHLRLQLADKKYAQVDITEALEADRWASFHLERYHVGDVKLAAIVTDETSGGHRAATLRSSIVSAVIKASEPAAAGEKRQRKAAAAPAVQLGTPTLTPGQEVSGFVVGRSKDGSLRFRVSSKLDVTVPEGELPRKLQGADAVPLGKLLRGRVVSVDPVQVTLQPIVARPSSNLLSYDKLRVGMLLNGTISHVADFGVFVSLDGTDRYGHGARSDGTHLIPGLCHHSEVNDKPVARGTLDKSFAIGDKVRVVVTELDVEKKRLSLSMKPSRLVEAAADDSVDVAEEDSVAPDASDAGFREASEDDSSVDGAPADHRGIFARLDGSDDEGDARAPLLFARGKRVAMNTDDASADSESEAEGAALPVKKTKRRALEEEETRRKEERIASGDADANPETEDEFERLVAATPNDSMSWIRYMAWQISLTEIEKARSVAERALETISFRLEQEKLNVWTAFMNMEAVYGTAASLQKIFSRAQAAADPKAVHYALLGIYQRLGASRVDDCEALFNATAKKFGRDFKKVWTEWANFRFRNGKANDARSLLQRALAVLPDRKKVETIMQFALLEYKYALRQGEDLGSGSGTGSTERGRTMFENLLSTCPKRVDIWSVYVDQEIRTLSSDCDAAVVAGVRRLLDRILSVKMSSKKMKFFFKKYLAFEREFGNDEGVAKVAAAAKAYVARQVSGAAELEAGSDDE